MINAKKKYALIAVTVIIFLTLSIVFGIYDLDISKSIVVTSSSFGLAMENAGMLAAPILCMAAGSILAVYCLKSAQMRYKKVRIALIIVIILFAACFAATIYVKLEYFTSFFSFLVTGLAMGVFIAFLRRMSSEKLYILMKMAIVTIIYFIAVLLVIDIIKLFWGRIRFREMDLISQFTPFYLPQGITGNYSFPSGHTANAATLFVVTMLSQFCKKKWQKALCYVVPIVWIVVMAFSRVLVGAHFASDVLFGGAISVGLFYITKHVMYKKLS